MNALFEIIAKIKPFLVPSQIIVSVALIGLILLQPRGEGLGSAFGQSFGSVGKLRGASKAIFSITIVLSVIFILLALVNLLS